MDDYTLSVIVADDEAPAREEILHLLRQKGGTHMAGAAGDGQEALRLIRKLKPDLAFLDIEMPGMSGIEVARCIVAENLPVQVIFTTAYEQFAIEAFEVNAVDYLLKPIRQEKLNRAVDRIKKSRPGENSDHNKLRALLDTYMNREEDQTRFISVYRGETIIPLKISAIHFAEARGRFVWVATDDGEYETTLSFSQASERLKPPAFFSCHRSYIIRPESIESIDLWVNSSYRLRMKGSDRPVPVSRARKEAFKKLMGL